MTASLNPYISQFGEEFDAEKSSQYRMTIQFSLGGLSYALLDTTSKTLIALECYQSDLLADSNDLFHALERALASKGLTNKSFHSVVSLVDNRFCTLVPESLFDQTEQAKYLDFAFQVPQDHIVANERLKATPCFNVFACSKTLHDKVLAKWKNATVAHTSSIFINSVMGRHEDHCVFVNVRNRDFDMVVQKKGRLAFFNNFRFNTKDDFAYFLMFAMEQNGLSGLDPPVCFSGLILPASEIVGLCGRYVRDLCFIEDKHELHISHALKEVPFQYYYIHYQALK